MEHRPGEYFKCPQCQSCSFVESSSLETLDRTGNLVILECVTCLGCQLEFRRHTALSTLRAAHQ